MSEEKSVVEKNVKVVENLVKKYIPEREEDIISMLETDVGANFFTAPASPKKDYHSCFDGGLVAHSISVAKYILILRSSLSAEDYFTEEEAVFVGLFHDFGKAGTGDEPYYVKQTDNWRRDKLNEYYTHNENLTDCLTIAQRSLRLLSAAGIEMTDNEYAAILFHDGLYVPENNVISYKYTKNSLVRISHMADAWSAMQLNV